MQQTNTEIETRELRFSAPEFLDYSRGIVWYGVMASLTLIVVVSAVLLGALTFAVVVLLAVALYFLLHHRHARLLDVCITAEGVTIDGRLYPAADIQSFWVVWQPPFVQDVHLCLRGRVSMSLSIHAVGQDCAALRALLSEIAPEEQRGEPFFDLLIRSLRL